MVRLWHSPQKLCFYNSSNNNSNNNSIDRTKKFWQNTECKKNSVQLNRLMPSTDSIPSTISINQLTVARPNPKGAPSATAQSTPF